MKIDITIRVGADFISIKELSNKKRYLINHFMDIDTQIVSCLANFISHYVDNFDMDSWNGENYNVKKVNRLHYVLELR